MRPRSLESVGIFADQVVPAPDREILSEEAFQRAILLERRRSERSRRPFLLMLLDMGDPLPPSGYTEKYLCKLLTDLSLGTRETDVTGWYKNLSVVGVMFTEIAFEGRGTIVSTMIARLKDILRDHLSLEQFNRIGISFHVFPDDWEQESRKRPNIPVLYPDLSKRVQGKRVEGALKRAIDIVGSIVALIFVSPLFL